MRTLHVTEFLGGGERKLGGSAWQVAFLGGEVGWGGGRRTEAEVTDFNRMSWLASASALDFPLQKLPVLQPLSSISNTPPQPPAHVTPPAPYHRLPGLARRARYTPPPIGPPLLLPAAPSGPGESGLRHLGTQL
ncbi:hypothetical protein AAFF_G00107370 [Aldrovandia affinis]|uniref:Uncharacterized protein n=1 Tax=Aldrovandia affinis TaxID=143900 RepID=A0AAD7WB92_9TELE|nr:hypothetical protein AAFF_G00107370 [Aldrovandia affinis]